ncbi:MAG: hemolysin III family protein [Deltaproteobacteria bacterium]|nr:hemolysin III family protein [Deltaproteobacteria bacterium]
MTPQTTPTESPQEERANTLTHALGIVLGLATLAILVIPAAQAGDPRRVVAFAVYGSSLVLLYLASTGYHAFRDERTKRRWRVFDHAAIYLLIAGTYTPVTLITLRGAWGWTLFGIVWGLALFGVIFTLFLTGRFKILSLAIYLAMGWIGVVAGKPLVAAMPQGGLLWLAAGGVAYTGGTVFYMWKRLPYHHAIWHLFVLAGSACHVVMTARYIAP